MVPSIVADSGQCPNQAPSFIEGRQGGFSAPVSVWSSWPVAAPETA